MTKIMTIIIKQMMQVCNADNTAWWTRPGYFFGFLARGTDCRCCLGMRIACAMIYGIAIGISAVVNKWLALGMTIGVVFALVTVFTIITMVEINDGETD